MVDLCLIEFDPALRDQLWPQIDEYQKREAAAVGITDQTFRDLLAPPFFASIAIFDRQPLAIYGYNRSDSAINVGMFSSPLAQYCPLEATKLAKAFVLVLSSDYPELPIYCLPGDWNPAGIRWLELIGFNQTGEYIDGVNGDQLAVMEWY